MSKWLSCILLFAVDPAIAGQCGLCPASAPATPQSADAHEGTGTTAPDDAFAPGCPAAEIAERLGRSHLMIGGAMSDEAFASAPFDIRYRYLVGPVPPSPCATCAHACEVGGVSCANSAGGCPWWGCWQWDGLPPGTYVANQIGATEAAGAIPMFTYYAWLSVSEASEGWDEVAALSDPGRMARYLADWRFFCRWVATSTESPVLAHVEPDLWGFGQQVAADPSEIPAAVRGGVAPECAGLPDTMAGLADCMLSIARRTAPNLLVGFHASSWGAGHDVYVNTDPDIDVMDHADRTAAFLRGLGAAEADFLVVEMSDRDAGAGGVAWDDSNTRLPNFDQALAWAARLSEQLALPLLWWQIPYGRQGLENDCERYEDNRVAYVFDHPERFAAGGAFGVVFGAGIECMTTPDSDDGHFIERARAYLAGERPCMCGGCAP